MRLLRLRIDLLQDYLNLRVKLRLVPRSAIYMDPLLRRNPLLRLRRLHPPLTTIRWKVLYMNQHLVVFCRCHLNRLPKRSIQRLLALTVRRLPRLRLEATRSLTV